MIKAIDLVLDEDGEMRIDHISDLANDQFLADRLGDYGLSEYEQEPFSKLCQDWLHAVDQECGTVEDNAKAADLMVEFTGHILDNMKASKGFAFIWSTIDGQDEILTYVFDSTLEQVEALGQDLM